jgi:hypothetical protein
MRERVDVGADRCSVTTRVMARWVIARETDRHSRIFDSTRSCHQYLIPSPLPIGRVADSCIGSWSKIFQLAPPPPSHLFLHLPLFLPPLLSQSNSP